MKLIEQEIHHHKFTKEGKKKVPVHKVEGKGAVQTATDLIFFRKCVEKVGDKVCGAIMAYELERTRV